MNYEEFKQEVKNLGIELGPEYSDGRDAIIDNYNSAEQKATPAETLKSSLEENYWDGSGVDEEKMARIKNFDIDKISIREECGESDEGDVWLAEVHYDIDGVDEVIAWVKSVD